MDIQTRFDRYAVLITVLSLMLVVTYADEPYDEWDCFIGFVGVFFGAMYLKSRAYFDLFSSFLGTAILVKGIIISTLFLSPSTIKQLNPNILQISFEQFLVLLLVASSVFIGMTTFILRSPVKNLRNGT
ncbi:hypothetical protein [Alteromonas macleodii]|uniref:hypothetical protein n=1 Tax=Alteromonas macleodii TaxID=28108 RepID=UPI003140122B